MSFQSTDFLFSARAMLYRCEGWNTVMKTLHNSMPIFQ